MHRNQEACPGASLVLEKELRPTSGLVRCLSPSPRCGQKQSKEQRGGCNICLHSYQEFGHFFPEVSFLFHLMKTVYRQPQCLHVFCVSSGPSLLKGGRFQSTHFVSQTTFLRDRKSTGVNSTQPRPPSLLECALFLS